MRYINCEIHNSHLLKGGGGHKVLKKWYDKYFENTSSLLFGHLELKLRIRSFGKKEIWNDYGITWVIALYIFIFNVISTIFILKILKLTIRLKFHFGGENFIMPHVVLNLNAYQKTFLLHWFLLTKISWKSFPQTKHQL